MDPKIKQLYQSVILKKSKAPFNFEKRPKAKYKIEANNPVCGDRFTLYLDIEGEQIKDAAFYGHGCAISKSATSILTQNLIGKSLEAAIEYSQLMLNIVDLNQDLKTNDPELLAFAAARDFPERATCASLSWEKTRDFIQELST
ncbi:MAG: SUF system NifU family Fe-S cluster assembly protein [Saprospiraceae bacterium]